MAEELKGLIEKIKKEGIQAAEESARNIENSAKERARVIVEQAKKEAEKLIVDARQQIAKMQDNTEASLKQTARDLLLGLRKEIETNLDKIIQVRVREVLKPDELAHIIFSIVENCSQKDKQEIVITLSQEDLSRLEQGFLAELKEKVKTGIRLRPSEDISGGFIISYDSGKSHFDFTDKSIAEYISLCIRPKLAKILSGIT